MIIPPDQAILRYAEHHHPGYSTILLFGSYVNGDSKPSSDLDAVIVFENAIKPFRQVISWEGYVVDAWIYDVESINGLICTARRSKNHVWLEIVISSRPLPTLTPQISLLKQVAKKVQSTGPLLYDTRDLRHRLTTMVDDLKACSTDSIELPALAFSLYWEVQGTVLFMTGKGGWKNKHAVRALIEHDALYFERMNVGLRAALAGDAEVMLQCASELLEKLGGALREGYVAGLPETVRVPLVPIYAEDINRH